MKNNFLLSVLFFGPLFSLPTFSQSKDQPVSLGLPGDNLDLYAVMEIFQKSKTIEDFEKILNDDKEGTNNLDLNNDEKVDFLKVITNKDGDSYSFVLQAAVSKTENQDVAVIFTSKDAAMQIVGDEDLYGKNYVIEPKGTGSSTVNPGYSGGETVNLPSTTEVVVQSSPIVQYVYSPAYTPYLSPFYFGFYPPYFRPWVPIMYGVYWSNHYHNHGGYFGGYNGSVNINVNNSNHFNNYNRNTRNRSNIVNNYNKEGRYKNNGTGIKGNLNNNRPSANNLNRPSTRPTSPSTRIGNLSTRPTLPLTKPTNPITRPSISPSTRPTNRSAGTSNNFSRPANKSSINRGAAVNRSAGMRGGGGGIRGGKR